MKQAHWSLIYVNFISIDVEYTDGARQGWDYDCSKFATIQDAEKNMAADFNIVREGWVSCTVHALLNDQHYSFDMGVPEFVDGEDFAQQVFEIIGEMLGWQPVAIS